MASRSQRARLLLGFLTLSILSAGEIRAAEPDSSEPAIQARFAGGRLDLNRVLSDLAKLSGAAPIDGVHTIADRRMEPNKVRVRSFLRGRLQELGYSVENEQFAFNGRLPGRSPRYGYPDGVNIVVEARGSAHPENVIEVSAHYDSVYQNVAGAVDNGSGVAAVLELARVLRELPPRSTVRLIFADYEEKGYQGSEFHAARLSASASKIQAAIVVDTIGFHPKGVPAQLALEVGKLSNFGRREEPFAQTRQLGETLLRQMHVFDDRRTTLTPLAKTATGWADHASYWRAGMPAVLIAAPFQAVIDYGHYHRPTDTFEKIDRDYFEQASRFTVESVALLAGTDVSPELQVEFAAARSSLRSRLAAPISPSIHLIDRELAIYDKPMEKRSPRPVETCKESLSP